MRQSYLNREPIETIYIGGGTPSLLNSDQIRKLIEDIQKHYSVREKCEITLEANPDDLSPEFLRKLTDDTMINRLSIGIQSFNDKLLKLLNRRHTARQALDSIRDARSAGFNNISIDLIYGIPGMDIEEWKNTLETAFSFETEHISAYHLSIEPGTGLSGMVKKGLLALTNEEESVQQFALLNMQSTQNGYIHYEISNLARKGFFSKHNSNYWLQKKYLGLGPSAHSFDLVSRQWNIRHVRKYIEALNGKEVFFEREVLSKTEMFNEYIMVSLRTIWGADHKKILQEFGEELHQHFLDTVAPFINSGHVTQEGNTYIITTPGWLISDWILTSLMKA